MVPPKFCEYGFDFVVVIGSQFRFLELCFVGVSSGYFSRDISLSIMYVYAIREEENILQNKQQFSYQSESFNAKEP